MSGSTRDLKRRIKSVITTEQMTKAMKTVAVSKYNKTLSVSQSFEQYALQCRRIQSLLGASDKNDDDEERKVTNSVYYVLVTGDRGLCGMYNIDLLHKMQGVIDAEKRDVKLIVCGKWGIQNLDLIRNAQVVKTFTFDSIPTYDQARNLGEYLQKLYDDNQADEISFVVQNFKNVLVQTPVVQPFLPLQPEHKGGSADTDYIFEPEKNKIIDGLVDICRDAMVYRTLLNCALGFHGSTLAAMRTAADNSAEMYQELSQKLNRIRQSSATTEVIELSGSAAAEYD